MIDCKSNQKFAELATAFIELHEAIEVAKQSDNINSIEE